MKQIKALFDPDGLLNPGVIINDDEKAHISNLKPMPAADEIVDRCIECGFCEPVCPSRTLTLSPRQRIVLYRELQHREREYLAGNSRRPPVDELKEVFEYQGVDTCAATGLCADRCPVGINTGDLVKKLRVEKYQRFTPIARWTADHFAATTTMVKVGLKSNQVARKLVGDKTVGALTNGLRKMTGGATPVGCRNTRNLTRTRLISYIPLLHKPKAQTRKWYTCLPVLAGQWASKILPKTTVH